MVTTVTDFQSPDGTFVVSAVCRNMPLGGLVSLEVTGPVDHDMPPTPIVTPNQMMGIQISDWPAGSPGQATLTYQPGQAPMQPGSSLTLQITVIAQSALAQEVVTDS
jgi:hypothetical protein